MKTSRTLTVGDIHGGLKGLKQALSRANLKLGDKLMFLGDYVDGWSESSEVVHYLLELSALHECIFIRGNHDKWCEDWLLKGQAPINWVNQGGQSTIDSYVRTGYVADSSHKQFFRDLRNYYIDDENRGFVHGGFISRKGLGHEAYESDYYWDRDMWQLAMLLHSREEEGSNKSLRFRKHKEVFIGHTSTLNWICKPHYPEFHNPRQSPLNGPINIPMNRCNVWNLDTGGGFKGKITVMDIDTKEFWQSDLMNTLYIGENGR